MEWKDAFTKSAKPAYSQLLDFFSEDARGLFLQFDKEMNEKFGVHNKYHRYDKTNGWVYGYGRSYNCELLAVTVHNSGFRVLGITVTDGESLAAAIAKASDKYNDGFEERYAALSAKRRGNQIERAKKRIEREKLQMADIAKDVNPETFNKFKWCEKVSRSDLQKLYKGEAAGMLDEDLLEDIGITFYMRCTQAKRVRELMEKGQMLCLQCGEVLTCTSYEGVVTCTCGYSYTYREYRRSCNSANMPGGRATPIFESYAQKWEGCTNAAQKMLLIDWLIHECHVTLMSDEQGRSVCVNLIEGTKKQISDLINQLAYGSGKV